MSKDSTPSTVFQGTIVIFAGTIVHELVSFFGQILAIRSLAPSSFGNIMLTMSIVGLIGPLSLIGVPSGVARLVSSTSERRDEASLIQSGFLITFLTGLISVSVLLVLRGRIGAALDNSTVSRLLPFFCLYILWLPLTRVGLSGLRGFKLSGRRTVAKVGGSVTGLLLFITFVAADMEFVGAAVYYVFSPLFVGLFGVYLLVRSINQIRQPFVDRAHMTELFHFSWPLALQGVLFILMTKTDLLMIGYFLTSQEVGLYGAVRPVATGLLVFLNSFNFLYLPVATEHFENEAHTQLSELFRIVTKWMILMSLPAVLVLTIFSADVIQVFYTQEYVPAAGALSILAVGTYFRLVVGPNGATIQALDRTKVNLLSSAIGTITNILLNVLLIPRFGMIGAAIATSVGFAVYNFVELAVIYRTVGVHPFSINSVKPLIASTIVFYLCSYFINFSDPVGLVLTSVLSIIVVLLSLPLTWSIKSDDMTVLKNLTDNALIRRALEIVKLGGE